MRLIAIACPTCRCVSHTPADRCRAIQDLVRPEEVAHLLRTVPAHLVPPAYSFVGSVARWLQGQMGTGDLAYIPDPEWCDRWCSPTGTLDRGGGDCDDLAILAASLLMAGGLAVDVVVGRHCNGFVCDGHAWVEGCDQRGWFLLEATQGHLFRRGRPATYSPALKLRPGNCRLAA